MPLKMTGFPSRNQMNLLKSLMLVMLLFVVGCGTTSPLSNDTVAWVELGTGLYEVDERLTFSVAEEFPGQLFWLGEYDGEDAEGYLAFEQIGNAVICEFIGSAGGVDISYRFERTVDELALLGFVLDAVSARVDSDVDTVSFTPGKTCICFGDAGSTCTDEDCDLAEDCGSGKPKCRWKSGVVR